MPKKKRTEERPVEWTQEGDAWTLEIGPLMKLTAQHHQDGYVGSGRGYYGDTFTSGPFETLEEVQCDLISQWQATRSEPETGAED